MTTLQKILITAGLILIIFLGFYFTIKYYKDINESLLLELNKKGELIKYSDSLQSYTAYINNKKADSLIALNTDLVAALKEAAGKTELVYVYNTITKYVNVPVATFPDSTTADQRLAIYKNKWLNFKATYKIKAPYDFNINNIEIPDSLILVQTISKTGRKTLYVKNHNPYVKINNLEALVEPETITNTVLDEDHWRWMLSYTYSPGLKTTNALVGVYSPFGIGVIGGYSNISKNFNENYNFGLSFIKKF
jgi:hypothetical protein